MVYIISYAFRHLASVTFFFKSLCMRFKKYIFYYALIVILTVGKTWCLLKQHWTVYGEEGVYLWPTLLVLYFTAKLQCYHGSAMLSGVCPLIYRSISFTLSLCSSDSLLVCLILIPRVIIILSLFCSLAC